MHLVLSRIAMLHIFLRLFVLAGFGCVVLDREWRIHRFASGDPKRRVPWWLLGAAGCAGLACAVMWSAVWFLPVYAVLALISDAGARRSVGVAAPWRGALRGAAPCERSGNSPGSGRAGGLAVAGVSQVGLPVAADLAAVRARRFVVQGPERQSVSAGCDAAGPAAGRVGSGSGRARVDGGSALDPAEDHCVDRSAVPRAVHRAWGVISTAPDRLVAAGAGPSGRRAG